MLNHESHNEGVFAQATAVCGAGSAVSALTFEQIEAGLLQRLRQEAESAPLRPAFYACIEGMQPGLVLSAGTGETMAVLHGDGLCYLCGEPSLSFVSEMKAYLPIQARATRRVFVPCTERWHGVLRCPLLNLQERRRISFDSPTTLLRTQASPFRTGSVNEAVIGANADFPVIGQQIAAWGSIDAFVARGKAFYQLDRVRHNYAFSIASSFAIGGGEVEISVATRGECRGKGYGKAVCMALIEWCFLTARIPVWSCASENTASQALAGSLGFRPKGHYSVFVPE